eukprot:Polyplicarium_translucidae@DN2034_c0_g1_i10.p2
MRELGAACGGRRVESAHRSPLHVMEDAYSAARLPGAATCCVVCLDAPRKFLHTANLGDSGFLIARKGRVLYKSPSQQHSLNCPFQLGSASQDRPADAQLASFEVEAGDHVLLASDGLWDNLYVDQIMALLEGADSGGIRPASFQRGQQSNGARSLSRGRLTAGPPHRTGCRLSRDRPSSRSAAFPMKTVSPPATRRRLSLS